MYKHTHITLLQLMELMRTITPPKSIVHIGAGTGQGDLHTWINWGVEKAFIIDADEQRIGWVKASNTNWHHACAVVGESNGERLYYHANNPAEDGLVPPDALVPLWRGLQVERSELRSVTTLDSLLRNWPVASTSTWAIVDCLPALSILRGAGTALKEWDVLWLRVLLAPLEGVETEATVAAAESALLEFGYRCIHIVPGNHPGIGVAVFLRDKQVDLDNQASKNNALLAEREISQELLSLFLDKRRVLHAKLVQAESSHYELKEQISKLQGQLAESLIQIQTLQAERDQATTELNKRGQLTNDANENLQRLQLKYEESVAERGQQAERMHRLQQELHAQHLERDKAAERIEQLGNRAGQLLRERDEVVVTSREQVAKLMKERDECVAANERRIAILVQERDQAVQKSNATVTQLASTTAQNNSLLAEKFSIQQCLNEAQQRIATLEQQIAETTQQITDSKLALDNAHVLQRDLEEKIKELERIRQADKLESSNIWSQLQARQTKIDELEAMLAESNARQKLLDEEIVKASAQLDLMKDVLLRDTAV